MGNSLLTVIGSIATVALIAIATRWLSGATGSPLPKTRDDTSVYAVKWQWRAVGLVGAVFWIIVSIWSWHDQHTRPDGVLIGITVAFVTAGLWLAIGSVTTNQTGITKKGLWHTRYFQWKDITEIRLHKKQGGAIELRSGAPEAGYRLPFRCASAPTKRNRTPYADAPDYSVLTEAPTKAGWAKWKTTQGSVTDARHHSWNVALLPTIGDLRAGLQLGNVRAQSALQVTL